MLLRLLSKRAHKLLRSCERGNGVEAYRQLSLAFGSDLDERGSTGLLAQIISYKFGGEVSSVLEHITEFKLKIKQHDEAPGTEPVQDAVLKTVLMNNVPEPLLTHLRLNIARYETSADVIREIEQYCR